MDVVWVAAVGVFCVIGVPLNFFWRDRLQRAAAQGVSLRSNYQFTLLELVVFTGIFGVTLAVAVDAIRHSHPQTAEHVAASYAPFRLPPGASDVSYHCRIRSGRWVEFTVDEPELIEWFEAGDLAFQDESLGVKLRESGLFLSVDRPGELSGPTSITIKNGLRAGWSEEGNGFKLYYDRDTKRAYYNVFFD
ncbi:hypothetical protein LOC69_15795 [Blastopirellula sp. JC733]|nr:hypothetical protein [Blastopirellula sediminis]